MAEESPRKPSLLLEPSYITFLYKGRRHSVYTLKVFYTDQDTLILRGIDQDSVSAQDFVASAISQVMWDDGHAA